MELVKIVERAKKGLGARSDRDLSQKLGHAPNYICKLLQDENPSPDALAELIEVGKDDPTVQVLQFIGEREGKRVKKIIDRALKALSAASLMLLLAATFSVTAPHSDASAAVTPYVQQCILWIVAALLLVWTRTILPLQVASGITYPGSRCYRALLPPSAP